MKFTKQQIASRKQMYEQVKNSWPLRKGKQEFLKVLSSEQVTRGEATLAQCYHCSGGYEDGPYDCKVATCPLYGFHPYRSAKARVEMTPEKKAALIAQLQKGRDKQRGAQA